MVSRELLEQIVKGLEQMGMPIGDFLTSDLKNAAYEARYSPTETKTYSAGSYRDAIYDAARRFWREGSRGNFISRMNVIIKFGLNDAWIEGAKLVGVEPDEFEPDDNAEIAGIIAEEKSHVQDLLSFLDSIANNPNRNLESANYRLDLWANRYNDIVSRAKLWFGDKEKLVWRMGPTETHCGSCSKLNGIVAWAREWNASGIRPQSSELECGGWNCKCELQPTDKRRTARALQRILDIMVGQNL